MMHEIEILIRLLSAMDVALLDITPQFSAVRKSKILQYRMNTPQNNPAWQGTISIRCSRIEDLSVGQLLCKALVSISESPQLIDRIGINSCTAYDIHTKEKCVIEGQRTIYLTLRPAEDVFEFLQNAVGQQEDYEPLITLLNILYARKFSADTEEKKNDGQH
jgi:hypothetical protein